MDIITQAKSKVDRIEVSITRLAVRTNIINTMEEDKQRLILKYLNGKGYPETIELTDNVIKPGTLDAIRILILNDVRDARDLLTASLITEVGEGESNNGEY